MIACIITRTSDECSPLIFDLHVNERKVRILEDIFEDEDSKADRDTSYSLFIDGELGAYDVGYCCFTDALEAAERETSRRNNSAKVNKAETES